MLKGSVSNIQEAMVIPTVLEIQGDLRFLCELYKNLREQYTSGEFDLVSELSAVPMRLWVQRFSAVESHREHLSRKLSLKEAAGDISKLPLPSGNAHHLSEETFSSLNRGPLRHLYGYSQ